MIASHDHDARTERMDRVALLYAEISAATREFLAALTESDRHGDWAEEGFGSCAEWLAWRVGITINAANEKVRAALALESLPLISEAMSRGELSFSKVRALTRVATPENEADLLVFARAGSAANLERVVRSWRWGSRGEELAAEAIRNRNRQFSVFPDGDGMYVVRGTSAARGGRLAHARDRSRERCALLESAPEPGQGCAPRSTAASRGRARSIGRAGPRGRVRWGRSSKRHSVRALPGGASCRRTNPSWGWRGRPIGARRRHASYRGNRSAHRM